MIAVYIAWGSTYLAIRFGVETIPPFILAGTRFLVAGGLLFIWRRLAGDPLPKRLEWRSAFIIGTFLLVGGNGGVTWAEQLVPSGITSLLVASAPLWMVLLDALHPRRRQLPTWQTLAGVALGFVGIVLLVGPSQLAGSGLVLEPAGVVVLLFSALFWAIGSLFGRDARLPDSPLMGTAMEMLAGSAGLFLLSTLTGEWGRLDLAAISVPSLLGLGYLIVFGSLVGYAAYTWLLRVAPTPLVATYAYVNPLIAILAGSLLANEVLNSRILAAALVIISATALINTARNKAPRDRSRAGAGEAHLEAVSPAGGED